MKPMMVALVVLAAAGCSKPAAEENTEKMGAPTEAADNSGRNERDKGGSTLTPGDQAENETDRTITQQIRQQVVKGDDLSINAKNVKIITVDGVVTLRGPVQSAEERQEIASVAKRVDGVKSVDNQLEIAAK